MLRTKAVESFSLDTVEECLEERLSEFRNAIDSGDAFVQHELVQEGEAHNVIYVGRSPLAFSPVQDFRCSLFLVFVPPHFFDACVE